MATIGTFTKQDNGGYTGALATLTVQAKVSIAPVKKTGDKSPDFRVYASNVEIGAAWSQKTNEGKTYLTVKLDDPSFVAPINARLVETDKGYSLVWTR